MQCKYLPEQRCSALCFAKVCTRAAGAVDLLTAPKRSCSSAEPVGLRSSGGQACAGCDRGAGGVWAVCVPCSVAAIQCGGCLGQMVESGCKGQLTVVSEGK